MILIVGNYSHPNPRGSNRNVFLQAKGLVDLFNYDVQILNWPLNDYWDGVVPVESNVSGLVTEYKEGIQYHIFKGNLRNIIPNNGNVLHNRDWEDSVLLGKNILKKLKPSVLHLHHRHGLWWILQSAQELGIPTIYTNHDWGLGCARTILLKWNNELCDGVVNDNTCSSCIQRGRESWYAKLNERLLDKYIFEKTFKILSSFRLVRNLCYRYNILFYPAKKRVEINLSRVTRILKDLNYCFTPSKFGKDFFIQLGVDENHIGILPWYYDRPRFKTDPKKKSEYITISYLGRLSKEKGVDLIFEAIKDFKFSKKILLQIAGEVENDYARELKKKYSNYVGEVQINWLGWVSSFDLIKSSDALVLPSQWIDNTPLVLIESISLKVPLIISDIPPARDLLKDGRTGFFFKFNDPNSLRNAIVQCISTLDFIEESDFEETNTLLQYLEVVSNVYKGFISN